MRPDIVVVTNKTPILPKQVKHQLVGSMKNFNLTTGNRPANASSDMLNTQL